MPQRDRWAPQQPSEQQAPPDSSYDTGQPSHPTRQQWQQQAGEPQQWQQQPHPNQQQWQQPPAGATAKPRKPWYKRVWVWILILVVFFFVVRPLLAGGDSSTESSEPTETSTVQVTDEEVVEEEEAEDPVVEDEAEEAPTEEAEAQAETVTGPILVMDGNADQQSDTIVLSGGKVTVSYDFTDNSGYGTIVGAIYVLPEGTDIMVDGAIPDVMVSEAGPGETILRKAAGEYYVRVSAANASYTITVEEG